MATNPEVFDFDIGDVTGKKGDTGNGISGIELLSTSGLQKTYRINMTNETHFDFVVTDGNGISGASFDAETNELTITFDNGTSFTTPSLKGAPGAPGDDGYSPAVTIETITGGHRVTITDKTHPTGQSFDVLDGEDGASDAGEVAYNKSSTYQAGSVGAELQEQNRQLSDVEEAVNDAAPVIINTASGAIASFADGADGQPIRKLVAQIEPVQDLHGYANPWPGGGGKNLLPLILTDIKSLNTAGTWNGNQYTINGITYTVQTDNAGNVIGIGTSGTATATAKIDLYYNNTDATVIQPGRILNGCPAGGAVGTYKLSVWGAGSNEDVGSGATINLKNSWCSINIYAGVNVDGKTFYPMIRLGTETDATFAPFENICPISGHTGAEIEQAGGNVWDEETELGYWNVRDGSASGSTSELRGKNFIPVTPNTQYYFNKSTDNRGDVLFFGKDQEYLHDYVPSVTNRTFTTPDNCYYIKINFGNQYGAIYNHDVSINYPATDTEYHPYTGNQISVTFPTEAGTVYGVTITLNPDRTGTLVVDRAMADLGTLEWSYHETDQFFFTDRLASVIFPIPSNTTRADLLSSIYQVKALWSDGFVKGSYLMAQTSGNNNLRFFNPSYTDATSFKAAMSGIPLVYKLANPITYQLTAEQISGILSTLYGTNNIWADVGPVSVEYPADTKMYIDNKITQAIAAALNA